MSVDAVAVRLRLQVQRRMHGGEWGAFLAQTATGAPVLLKVLAPHPRLSLAYVEVAMRLAEALRRRDYPVPRYLDFGTVENHVYTVQEVVDGEVPPVLRFEHVRQLVALWSVHQNVAVTGGYSGGGWAENVVRGLRVGTEAVYVDHRVLRASSDRRVQRVLDAAIAIGMRTDPGIFRTGDVVHGDFHHRNLLVRGDNVVAVFDWEGAHPGDARADLLTLASMPPREQIDPRGAEFLSDQLQTIPAEVREPLAALGALQRITFAVRTRPQALEWALATAAPLLAAEGRPER